MALTQVTRTYLEMTSPEELRPVPLPEPPPRIEEVRECPVSFFRYLYAEVGRPFHWTDRLAWSDERVREYLASPDVSLWLMTWQAAPAGYFELKRHDDDSVEVAYFGLLPEYIGRGWGKHLLVEAVRAAWALHPQRVRLHTCTLDHPAALPNYLQRGFRAFREERYTVELSNPVPRIAP
jgi:ribosomal protein S18 acetylase RimI-like enzyme